MKEDYSLLNDFNIRERWSVFGEDVAQYVVSRMSSRIDESAALCTVICFFTLNFPFCTFGSFCIAFTPS